MEKKLRSNIKRENGITLVALVVTIVVLLILAFVSISLLMGENGIINKAEESKEETIKAKEREIIKLAYQDLDMEYALDGTDITADRVWEKLMEYDGSIKVEMKTKEELGDTEIVVEKNSGEEYAEITYEETGHKYAGSLVIDENKARYEVTYNANRGYGGPTKQTKIEGVPLTITTEIPERTGYSFKGWSKDSTAVVAEYVSGSQYTEDANVTLYAVWQIRDDIEPVAQIGSIKYPSIQEAIYDCSQEAGDTATTIILLKDTEEEFRTFEGQNIILDLQGYTVTSESTGALCTNNGKIQIENGELRSNNGTTIINNGEVTIGDNSNGIDNNTPTIYGKNVGIENNGTFNFYDGKIQGIIPIQGTATNTPEGYGPVQTGYENGITTIQLGIVTGYEARIGYVYYTTVQGAVNATNTNVNDENRDTVTIVKNIQLKDILEISEEQNIILDLNGYELTITEQDRVINNNGNLEVTDSSIEQTGKIAIFLDRSVTFSNQIYTVGIYNNDNQRIKVSGGIIEASSTGSYNYSTGVYNVNNGTIEVTGGTVSSSGSDASYGIYNASSGSVKVEGGTVSSNSSYSYGIYNKDSGSIEVIGGIVSSSGNSNSDYVRGYGIYNASSGDVKVEGGTVSSSSSGRNIYGIYNASSGNIEVTGGTVSSNRYGIYNAGSGSVKVEGGTVSSSSSGSYSYGIYNGSSGSITVEGGIVSGSSNITSYGIYNASSGTIIIGTEQDGTISQKEPNIKGEDTETSSIGNGIYNIKGTLEFYNGLIQGNWRSLIGSITKIRDGYEIENSMIEEKDSIYLVEKNEEYIVKIEDVQYTSLQKAIDSIGENEEKTIEILKDFKLNEPIIFNKNIILNLNGYTITNNYYRIENNSNLRIIDNTEKKEGKIENINTETGILNNGEGNIIIEGGTVISNSNSSKSNAISDNINYGIYNASSGSITVKGGTVNSNINSNFSNTYNYGIYNASSGSVKVEGGAVSSSNSNSFSYGIYNSSNGNIEVTGGTVSSNGYGIKNDGRGKVSGGIINCSMNGSLTYGIYNTYGAIEVTGGIVSDFYYGIYNNSGSIEVTGGTINSSAYGIYHVFEGSITIGIKGDGIVSQEEPYIKGDRNGIYITTGELYYYDGKIEGGEKAIYDIITEREENTELNYNENETILTLSTTITNVAQIGEITYPTLQEAIESVGNEQATIKILRNVTYTNQDAEIIIPDGKNIILDLNRYRISSSIPEQVIRNEGTLEIIDTSEEQTGTIITSEDTTIRNVEGARLTISGGTIENRTTHSIYNEGEFLVTGGTVSSNSYGIYNVSTGSVTLEGGTVNGDDYGIYNESSGVVEVTGGTVSSSNDSNSYGIYNESSGVVEVTGGTVNSNNSGSYSNSYGIYNASSGNIAIGTKGDGIVSQEEPYIKGEDTGTYSYNEYGVYNPNGNLYYYDGKIEGSTKGISGNITEIEDNTELLITEDTTEILQLEIKETNVARVNGVEYDSIQKAVEACGETESTIEILRESNPGATIIIGENQNITIDLKGYTINNYTKLQNNGTLKIIDTSSEQSGKIVGLAGTAVSNSGTMTVESGGIADSGYGIQNTGTLNITGGNITNNTYGIYNDGNGTTTIAGGNINSNTYGIYNYVSSSTINVDGGNITSNQYGIYNSNGTTNISRAGITNNDYGIYNEGGTTNIKEGAEVQSNIGIYNASGRLNIGEQGTMNPDSPIITGETYGLVNSATGIVYMYDGQVRGKEGATQGYITYTESGYAVANKTEGEYNIDYLALAGTVETVAEVNGIAFSNLQSAINSVIGEETQTVKLTNGVILESTLHISEGQNIILDMNEKTISSDLEITIQNEGNLTIIDSTSSGVGKISSTTGVAIENSGTLTIGEDDGIENPNLITIEGVTQGITNTGTLNVYDGTIRPE